MNSPLFVIALVLGVLKLGGAIVLSWWWIALIWPGIPLFILTVAGLILLVAAVTARRIFTGEWPRFR